ncbi:MAG: hypothetical protein M3496_04940 [Pseudomonadota bacterium]|nr:DUF4124 domain-containing protein [Burkholderiaceae bacterium]MDQ3445509.1 hypothetical protein [Pseudomonadota bacterium]
MKVAHVAAAFLLTLPSVTLAQAIQRCEGSNQRITYSNAECPAGTKPVKAVAPAPKPSAESQAAAKEKLQRYRDELKAPSRKARAQPASGVSDTELSKATDCAYLQASIDSSRQLRNVLTTRSYYSTEDVDAADARTNQLINDYRRVCG